MTNRLKCPECGGDEFGQNCTTSYDEYCVVSFSLLGEVDDERIENREGGTEEDAEAHHCCRCGWLLVDENDDPITEPDEVVAAFESARLAHQKKNGKPADIEEGIHMNREDVIEKMVDQYREELEEQDDDELLGGTLEQMREDAKVLFANTMESVRGATIEEKVEQYQRELESKSDHELIGGQDDSEQ